MVMKPEPEAFQHDDQALPEPDSHKDISQNQEGNTESNLWLAVQRKHTQTEAQTTKQPFCQLTMQNTWSSNWCTKRLENPRGITSIHGPSSQGPRTTLMIHTKPTDLALRS